LRIALVLPKAAPETLVYGDDFCMEPMGLLYLSACLMSEGHETVVNRPESEALHPKCPLPVSILSRR
jgi:hypothetical protein